jgi:hypothetical protein
MRMPDQNKIKQAFRFFDENQERLTENGRHFIRGVKKYYSRNKELSDRQQKALFEIRDKIKSEVEAKAGLSNKVKGVLNKDQ